jgi:cellulose synthase/poly-beta-1,6-N-acetylglucosamine synthase-like glycosyltransferase
MPILRLSCSVEAIFSYFPATQWMQRGSGNLVRSLSIVVPCYNEEAVINETARRLSTVIDELIELDLANHESSIYLVDDGSSDGPGS